MAVHLGVAPLALDRDGGRRGHERLQVKALRAVRGELGVDLGFGGAAGARLADRLNYGRAGVLVAQHRLGGAEQLLVGG